ncbi:MAG: chitosanase [bacterium]|nr:chitosanase [bacterium]
MIKQIHILSILSIFLLMAINISFAQTEFTSDQQRRANQLVSLFEHGTIEIRYDDVDNLDDGRGYTCGRGGFTTATGDVLEVVKRYLKHYPDSPLSVYLPELKRLAKAKSDAVEGLPGFPEAWKAESEKPQFCDAQDAVIDEWYWKPAQTVAEKNGIVSPLGIAILFDTIIQHGDGSDADGLGSLLRRTRSHCDGSPKGGKVTEAKFLRVFLATRRATLEHAHDSDTREVWSKSTGRIDVLESLLHAGNFELQGPLKIRTKHHKANIP